MMALAVGELGHCLNGGATITTSVLGKTLRERSSCHNTVHIRAKTSQKVELRTSSFLGRILGFSVDTPSTSSSRFVVRAGPESAAPEKPISKTKYPGENKGFVEEMRFVAMKLHTKDQSKEGEKQAEVQPVAKWEPSMDGYIKFLVDSKKVYDVMETIVAKASHPSYVEFRNTGLERSKRLAKDLEWFESQGHTIPEAGPAGTSYADYLTELSETNVPAFICHFYNVYFAHSAGGRFIGKKVAEMILNGRELEFYKWDGELPELLAAVKTNLNKVAEGWTREEKNKCLEETDSSFKYSGKILRLIIAQ